jgi:hypothetical protein
VQLQNGLADLDTKDRAAADAKRKQIKEVTGKAAQLAWAIKNAPPEQKGRFISMSATPRCKIPDSRNRSRDARAVHAGD